MRQLCPIVSKNLVSSYDVGMKSTQNSLSSHPDFPQLFVLDHPLVKHKLSHMRDVKTSTRTFRQLLRELTLLMGYEITRDLPLTTERIETPLTAMDAPVIAPVPVLNEI